jgi:hypothetical protein
VAPVSTSVILELDPRSEEFQESSGVQIDASLVESEASAALASQTADPPHQS